MQYSPKLKIAMEEIKAILKKHDIAGSVILHTPGFSEYLLAVDPSYSVITLNGNALRFKTKGRSKEDVTNSTNMVCLFKEVAAMMFESFSNMEKMLEHHMAIENTPPNHTGHIDQNN